VALLFITVAIILILEMPGLIQCQMWRELVVFCGLLILGIAYGIVHILQLNFLNPTYLTQYIFEPLFNSLDSLLK